MAIPGMEYYHESIVVVESKNEYILFLEKRKSKNND